MTSNIYRLCFILTTLQLVVLLFCLLNLVFKDSTAKHLQDVDAETLVALCYIFCLRDGNAALM